jgi:hypothetical protein
MLREEKKNEVRKTQGKSLLKGCIQGVQVKTLRVYLVLF